MDQNSIAQKIRAKYTEKQTTDLDMLRAMDAEVKRPANVFSYVFGSISAIVMGAGMSLVMTDVGSILGMESAMIPGIFIGVIGMLMSFANYPIYKKILEGRKKKYGPQILALSEKIMDQ